MAKNVRFNSNPPPPIIYTGPDVPTVYDSGWQFYTNLTSAQIAWFQSQPEWQNFLAYVALSPSTSVAGAPVDVVNAALQNARQTLAANIK